MLTGIKSNIEVLVQASTVDGIIGWKGDVDRAGVYACLMYPMICSDVEATLESRLIVAEQMQEGYGDGEL